MICDEDRRHMLSEFYGWICYVPSAQNFLSFNDFILENRLGIYAHLSEGVLLL